MRRKTIKNKIIVPEIVKKLSEIHRDYLVTGIGKKIIVPEIVKRLSEIHRDYLLK